MSDPIRNEAVRALYGQMRMGALSAFVIIGYVVCSAALFNDLRIVACWATAALVLQTLRFALIRRWRLHSPSEGPLEPWARAYVGYQVLSGACYGSSMLLFAHGEQPITVALSMACVFATTSGSLPALSYTPAAAYGLLITTFAFVVCRLVTFGGVDYAVMAIASALFGLMLVGFTRNQKRVYDDGFRIRFENLALVEALRIEKAQAERARQVADGANLAKSQFLAAASHDLRQPLYALSLFCASLGSIKLDEGGRAVMNSIQDSVAAMESLFSGLLDVSRLDAGVVESRPCAVSVDLLFDRLCHVYNPIAIEQGLTLRFRSDGEWIETDLVLLEQVLSNLLSNALRYTTRGGVLVAARRRPGEVRLEVWDTGCGISKEDEGRIFEEFVQVENRERDRQKGLGLGLAIAQRSAALIGARIAVKSRLLRGSCFSLGQPLAVRPVRSLVSRDADLVPRPSAVSVRDSRPVLIVDDDRDIRLALGHLLDRWQIPFETASNADDALQLIDAGTCYGKILVDFRLSGRLNGLELILAIRAKSATNRLSCSLITGDFDPGLLSTAQAHQVPLFHKPLRPATLREILGLPHAAEFGVSSVL